jgi:hypothetical protein
MSANRARKRHPDPPEPPYEWPMITVVHPDHGSFRFHVHGIRGRGPNGHSVVTLVAFGNGASSHKQVDMVLDTAHGTHSEIIRVHEDDISEDLGIVLAEKQHANPEAGVLIVPGAEWGLLGEGREVVHHVRP